MDLSLEEIQFFQDTLLEDEQFAYSILLDCQLIGQTLLNVKSMRDGLRWINSTLHVLLWIAVVGIRCYVIAVIERTFVMVSPSFHDERGYV